MTASILRTTAAALVLGGVLAAPTHAQIARGATKFLGNITTNYNYVDSIRPDFGSYWNQITNENACKWGSVEATQNRKNWGRCDSAYKYAKRTGIPFKFHTLIWGSQMPTWLANLSTSAKTAAITSWMDSAAARYPDAEYIDVVNEAVPGHAPFPDSLALGGQGTTGYDWVIKSFEMARTRWPKAKLILNDYNNIRWNVDQFIVIAKAVANSTNGKKIIDGIGCQAHDLGSNGTFMDSAALRTVLTKLYTQTGLPIYIAEMDLSDTSDTRQLNAYKTLFPAMWQSPYVAGITLWGYVYGTTWSQAAYSGLIKVNGTTVTERPAMTWLKTYVAANLSPTTPVAPTGIAPIRQVQSNSQPRLQMVQEGGRLSLKVVGSGLSPVDLQGRH